MYFLDKYLIMYWYDKSDDSDGEIIKEISIQLSYYLSFTPFLILIMIPTNFRIWQTYVIYIPFFLLIILIIWFFNLGNKLFSNQKFVYEKPDIINNNSDNIFEIIKDYLNRFIFGYEKKVSFDEIEKHKIDLLNLSKEYCHPFIRT
jgi:hypothetical protein